MCISGEIIITTPLRRDYKKEKKVEGKGLENFGEEDTERETQGNTWKLREIRKKVLD